MLPGLRARLLCGCGCLSRAGAIRLGPAEQVTVRVGETQASWQATLEDLRHPQLTRQWLMLALAVVLLPFGLTMELRALMKRKNDAADREPMELEPNRV